MWPQERSPSSRERDGGGDGAVLPALPHIGWALILKAFHLSLNFSKRGSSNRHNTAHGGSVPADELI